MEAATKFYSNFAVSHADEHVNDDETSQKLTIICSVSWQENENERLKNFHSETFTNSLVMVKSPNDANFKLKLCLSESFSRWGLGNFFAFFAQSLKFTEKIKGQFTNSKSFPK